MYNYRTICICGGGGLGHTIAASLNHNGYQVNLLTGHPEQWSKSQKYQSIRKRLYPFLILYYYVCPVISSKKLCMQSPHMLITILRSGQSLAVVVFSGWLVMSWVRNIGCLDSNGYLISAE